MAKISTSIHLPVGLHEHAKTVAAEQHMSLGALARQALQAHLDGEATPVETPNFHDLQRMVIEVEKGLDRVLVAVVRLEDRITAAPHRTT